MLVIIYGPSCGGKTTIIRKLCVDYGFKPVIAHTTRKSRPIDYGYDFARVTVSKEKFDEMNKNNEFSFVNQHFNNFYGTSKSDVNEALANPELIYVTDYSLNKRKDFDSFECVKIVIKPKTEYDLKLWIQGANRHERMNDIIEDYYENYSDDILENLKQQGYIIVINEFGILDEIVEKIYKRVKNINGSLYGHRP